jgi:hypothetical protein
LTAGGNGNRSNPLLASTPEDGDRTSRSSTPPSVVKRRDSVKAEIISCIFTEPHAGTAYNTKLETLTVTYDVEKRRERFRNVSFRRTGTNVFQLQDSKRRLIQRLRLCNCGQDGQSDKRYAYDVRWFTEEREVSGGCTSNGR